MSTATAGWERTSRRRTRHKGRGGVQGQREGSCVVLPLPVDASHGPADKGTGEAVLQVVRTC